MADTKKPLTDLTYYGNRSLGGIDDPNDPRAQAALAAAQQYDPNARFNPTYGSDGQLLGYSLYYDQSKMPGVSGSGQLGASNGGNYGGGMAPITGFSTVQPNMHLANPNATVNSPIYGTVTDNRNIKQQEDWISKWGGPALVALFSMGVGGLAGLMSDGVIGGAGSAGAAGAGGLGSDVGYDPWVESGTAIPDTGTAAAGGMSINPDTLATAGMSGNSGYSGLLDTGGAAAGTQAAAPVTDLSRTATIHDMLHNGMTPGLANVGASLSSLTPTQLLQAAGKIPGLLGGGSATGATGGGGMGGGMGGLLGGGAPAEDATAILSRFYGMPSSLLSQAMRGR